MRSVLSEEKKLSIAALSQTLADRLIEQMTRVGQQPLELFAGVLAAAIGVMQQRIGFAAAPDRHHEGIGDKLGRHRCAHRPTDHAPGEQIDHRTDVEPTFRRPYVGEVCNPFVFPAAPFSLINRLIFASCRLDTDQHTGRSKRANCFCFE